MHYTISKQNFATAILKKGVFCVCVGVVVKN